MPKKVLYHNKPGLSLRRQKNIGQQNLPFTLNPCIGCLFGCSYCYVQWSSFKNTEFGKEVKVKTWMPQRLNKELRKYQELPQHLKRVHINTNCEGYLPLVMIKTEREFGKDIMRQVLEVFKGHWDQGNFWMLHLFTKSHLVSKHLDLLREMRHHVQVELSIPTLYEAMRREFEGHAPSVKRRLRIIEQLSGAGVFVRVMAMPIFRREEAERIRHVGFDHGARGFQHRGGHFWGGNVFLGGTPQPKPSREYWVFQDLLVKSGEQVREQDLLKTKRVIMPDLKWQKFEDRYMTVQNFGYSDLNDIDWGCAI